MARTNDDVTNPMFVLKTEYQTLMAIKEPTLLYSRVAELMTNYHKLGLATRNSQRLVYEIAKVKDDLTKQQMLVTNFMLKAEGNGVLFQRRG